MEIDILVSGAGVVGLSAAIAMARQGFSVALLDGGDFEASKTEDFQRVYAINTASKRLFEDLDVWSSLSVDSISPYRGMRVWDASSSANIEFDCRSLAMPELGFIIGDTTLKQGLFGRAKQESGIQWLPKQRIQKISEANGGIVLETSALNIEAQLLMVAEGGQSSTRSMLNVGLHEWSYHQSALVARVACTQPHQQCARQVFLPSGPLAFLPLVDAHHCSIVWSLPQMEMEHYKQMEASEFNRVLSQAFAHTLGEVELMGSRQSFPLRMRHVKQYSAAHWMLLGDAAHTIHPMAGLGLNMGLADLRVWLELSQSSGLSKRALSAYQRQRKSELWKTIYGLQAIKILFETPSTPVQHLRSLGLNTLNRLPSVKQFFIREASGM